ncbi:Acetyltransferase (GNAT) family protein [Duganella sacchari]|uniref:Acetyltransferase (GNAT) family protein n=1 Tax=Duganella sacchari TaxID=551987 RepID=A0A1M7PKE5_9BURK|nr:GNAT family N-acetyltransferase [Duganella sacchari]SHN17702.1 Acetyltransferase (GNAT) family protein [Duganella sacchari]
MYLSAIRSEKTLCHSKAFAFVIREYAALLALGHVEPELPFANQSQVCYGLDGAQQVIAAVVYSYDPNKRAMWLQFSAVEAAHRQRGAYRELFHEVSQAARKAGAVNLYAGIATDNHAMHAIAGRLERQPVMVRYRYTLDDPS